MAARKKTVKKTAKKVVKKVVKKASAKKKTTKKVVEKKTGKTHVAFVIDYSSSMQSIRKETIEHVNEQIDTIRAQAKDMETFVSLVKFNEQVNCDYMHKDLEHLQPLTINSYNPRGSTAMLDAVGYTLDRLAVEVELAPEDAVLVVVVSDGQENASHMYDADLVSQRVRKLQKTNQWTFSYLGANQDLATIENMGIPKGNICAFTADSAGMRNATTRSVDSATTYLSARRLGTTSVTGYYTK